MDILLSVENLCKSHGNFSALDHVSFSLLEGQIIGLAGESGSGKTTLLRCIQGIDSADSGSVVSSCVKGFMFQDFQLFPHMTVIQNLLYAPSIHSSSSALEDKALSFLERLGIAGKRNSYPAQLSGGQKQRVALCRSLMVDPRILLCDEPTSGLDFLSVSEVSSLLNSIREMGVSFIIASHNLDFLSLISDLILVLKSGKIVHRFDPRSVEDPLSFF